jgi:hypothetical protein
MIRDALKAKVPPASIALHVGDAATTFGELVAQPMAFN